MFKLLGNYPTMQKNENFYAAPWIPHNIMQVTTLEDIQIAQQLVKDIYVDERIIEYIVNIVSCNPLT